MRWAGRDTAKKARAQTTALQHAVKLLSARPYAEKKLREKLLGRGYDPNETRLALDRLKNDHLLDDRRFAEDFVRARLAARPRAASLMIRELIQRGVAKRIAEEVAREAAPRESDERFALELLRRKQGMYAALDENARRRRLTALLARRGFDFDTIRKVLRIPLSGDDT